MDLFLEGSDVLDDAPCSLSSSLSVAKGPPASSSTLPMEEETLNSGKGVIAREASEDSSNEELSLLASRLDSPLPTLIFCMLRLRAKTSGFSVVPGRRRCREPLGPPGTSSFSSA